jgi:hypothetical protein
MGKSKRHFWEGRREGSQAFPARPSDEGNEGSGNSLQSSCSCQYSAHEASLLGPP